jgi:hypothetical protein
MCVGLRRRPNCQSCLICWCPTQPSDLLPWLPWGANFLALDRWHSAITVYVGVLRDAEIPLNDLFDCGFCEMLI